MFESMPYQLESKRKYNLVGNYKTHNWDYIEPHLCQDSITLSHELSQGRKIILSRLPPQALPAVSCTSHVILPKRVNAISPATEEI